MDQTRALKVLDLAACLQVVISMGAPNFRFFSSFGMRVDFNNFWWTWEPTRRTFKKKLVSFFWQKKNSEVTTEISFCEFGFFSAPPQKTHQIFRKFAVLAPRSTKNYSNRPVSRVTKNYSVSCLVLLVWKDVKDGT